jgi:hypothetical protein
MHAFIYRLVERLTREGPPFSRNRHFHTFESPEGKQALRIARRLRSVAVDIGRASGPPRLHEAEGRRLKLEIPLRDGVRIAWLSRPEWQLLRKMPPLSQGLALGEAPEERPEAGEGLEGKDLDRRPGRG